MRLCYAEDCDDLREWRNGRRNRLRTCRGHTRGGSNPSSRTRCPHIECKSDNPVLGPSSGAISVYSGFRGHVWTASCARCCCLCVMSVGLQLGKAATYFVNAPRDSKSSKARTNCQFSGFCAYPLWLGSNLEVPSSSTACCRIPPR